jgi:hypothetical protein
VLLAGGLVVFLSQGPGGDKQTAQTQALRAVAGDTEATLTWAVMPEANGYFVYRDGSAVALNSAPVTNTQYDDIGLTNGRVYNYTVAPAGKDGQAGKHTISVAVTPK